MSKWNGDPENDEGWRSDGDGRREPSREIPQILPLNVICSRGPWGAIVVSHARVYSTGFVLVVREWEIRCTESKDEWWAKQPDFFDDDRKERVSALTLESHAELDVSAAGGGGHGGRSARERTREFWVVGPPTEDTLHFRFVSGIPEARLVEFDLSGAILGRARTEVLKAAG